MSKPTDDFILKLASGLKPKASADSGSIFLAKLTFTSAIVLGLWFAILPPNPLIPTEDKILFILNVSLWFALAMISGFVVYRRRIPSLRSGNIEKIAMGLAVLLLVSTLANSSSLDAFRELDIEMSLSRGFCGPLIFCMALSWGGALFWWTKKGASTSPAITGAWVAISSGSLAAFATRFICNHENSFHLIIWHVLPIALLSFIGVYAGRRWLSW